MVVVDCLASVPGGALEVEREENIRDIEPTTYDVLWNICEKANNYRCPYPPPLTEEQSAFESLLVIKLDQRVGPIIGQFMRARVTPVAPSFGGRVQVPLEVRTLLRELRHRVHLTMEGPFTLGHVWAKYLWGFVNWHD